MGETGGNSSDRLSAGWMIAGALLFALAIGAPIAAFNLLPAPDLKSVDESFVSAAAGEVDDPNATQADAPDGDELQDIAQAASDEPRASDELGSLGVLIETQQETTVVDSQTLRRMIIDAVAVDLESTGDVLDVSEMHVSLRDCDSDEKPVGPDTEAFERTLSRMLEGQPAPEGPFVTFPGIRIAFCDDLTRVSAVTLEALKTELNPETSATLVMSSNQPSPEYDTNTVHVGASDSDAPLAEDREIVAQAGTDLSKPLPLGEPGAGGVRVQSGLPKVDDAVPAGIETVTRADNGKREVLSVESSAPKTPVTGTNASLAAVEPSKDTLNLMLRDDAKVAHGNPSDLAAMNGKAYEISDAHRLRATDQGKGGLAGVRFIPPELITTDPDSFEIGDLPHLAVSSDAEIRLGLTSRARRTAQLRLTLLGYDPRGVDGIFGPATREAISKLQRREALPQTGFLDVETLQVLERKSRREYRSWQRRRQEDRQRRRDVALAKTAPAVIPSVPAARRAPDCVRDDSGTIVSNQSFSCDLSVLRESLDELFSSPGKT
ncbi:MAG: peptidoglycan-binding domain-containing protein [Pseudomonadota bacterium]